MVWQVSKHARLDTYDEMCVSLCEREKEKYERERLAHRLDYAPLIAELAREYHSVPFPLYLSLPFKYTYLAVDSRETHEKSWSRPRKINEGSGRESRRVGVFFQRMCWRTQGWCAFIATDRNGRKCVRIGRTQHHSVNRTSVVPRGSRFRAVMASFTMLSFLEGRIPNSDKRTNFYIGNILTSRRIESIYRSLNGCRQP